MSISYCWQLFKIAELTEVIRQNGDETFIDLLNNIRADVVTDPAENIL